MPGQFRNIRSCSCTEVSKASRLLAAGSMSGHRPVAGAFVYSCSKQAVRSLTEGLRVELRQRKSHIRVAVSIGGAAAYAVYCKAYTPEIVCMLRYPLAYTKIGGRLL